MFHKIVHLFVSGCVGNNPSNISFVKEKAKRSQRTLFFLTEILLAITVSPLGNDTGSRKRKTHDKIKHTMYSLVQVRSERLLTKENSIYAAANSFFPPNKELSNNETQ